jgi:hypothetical protein
MEKHDPSGPVLRQSALWVPLMIIGLLLAIRCLAVFRLEADSTKRSTCT